MLIFDLEIVYGSQVDVCVKSKEDLCVYVFLFIFSNRALTLKQVNNKIKKHPVLQIGYELSSCTFQTSIYFQVSLNVTTHNLHFLFHNAEEM